MKWTRSYLSGVYTDIAIKCDEIKVNNNHFRIQLTVFIYYDVIYKKISNNFAKFSAICCIFYLYINIIL